MNEVKRALRPVKRRLRLLRLLRGVGVGALAAGAALLCVAALSFLLPIEKLYLTAALTSGGALLLCALIAFLLPIRDMDAARAADAHGLKERAQTALSVSEHTQMYALLISDTVSALEKFDYAQLRLPSVWRKCAVALGMAALAAALCLLPNPKQAEVKRAQAFESTMEEAALLVEEAAKDPMEALSQADRQELRLALEELERELERAEDAMDALLAVENAQQRIEKLQQRMAGDALSQMDNALRSGGLSALADALEGTDAQQIESALADADANALAEAAEGLDGEIQSALGAAARGMQSGDVGSAARQLSQIGSAAQASAGQKLSAASKLTSALRSMAGASGASGSNQGAQGGQGAGQTGQSGGGAGQGSTNQGAQGAGRQESSGGHGGNADPKYKEGQYERIYDPTRLNADQTEISAQSPQGEGETAQVQLGPGAGTMGEGLPYNQVVYDYASAAAQAADSQNLTAREREWVNSYFTALTQ